MIKPYPDKNLTEEQKIYNYRLSCCCWVIENAFGILSEKWRIFHRPIRATVEHVGRYVLAALALHNYLRQTSAASYTPNGFVDSEERDGSIHLGEWRNRDNRQCMEDTRPIHDGQNRVEVIQMREDIKTYFNSGQGSLPWQLDYVRTTCRKDNL